MADLATIAHGLPIAPASLDGSTVALWVIGALVLVSLAAVGKVWRLMETLKADAEAREKSLKETCTAERVALIAKIEARDDKIHSLLEETVRVNTEAWQGQNAWFKRFFDDTESGQHRAIDRARRPPTTH